MRPAPVVSYFAAGYFYFQPARHGACDIFGGYDNNTDGRVDVFTAGPRGPQTPACRVIAQPDVP